MIYTNEPSNVLYVYLTAYRATNSRPLNEIFLLGMINHISKFPGEYGTIETSSIQGCFREEGRDYVSSERTIRVRCTDKHQATNLADLACHRYDQDAVLVVNSQTHTSYLWSVELAGEYPLAFPKLKIVDLEGTLQSVETPVGECYSIDENGKTWEVI